nr:MAG TPA: minor capsid protein [Bacteriophage sp.]
MLTPNELKVVPDNIVKIYQDLEDDIISDITRRLQKVGSITDTADWQIYMLGNMGNDLETIKKRITATNKISKQELDNLFSEAAGRSMEYENIAYKKAGKKTLSLGDSPTMLEFVKANSKKTYGDLKNLTKSLGFKVGNSYLPIAKTYQDTLNYAQFQVASGAFSHQQAIKIAVKKLADSGLRYIDYESGTSSMLDVAVRRATLTGINQTTAELSLMQMDELGGEFVEVSAHMGARPDHAEWQGQVYHVGGAKDGYGDFEESTGYGTGDGLCGWNCRHSFSVFFPGISTRNYTDEHLKNIDPPDIGFEGKTYSYYEATQNQRRIERMIRKTKREMIGFESAGAKEDFTWAGAKLQRQKQLYRDFSNAAGLKMRHERHQVYGFGKSVSQKGVWVNRKRTVEKATQKGYDKNKLDFALDRVLEHGKRTGKEGLMWLDLDYNPILPFATGNKKSVGITREDMRFLMAQPKDSIISLHNHPSSSSFSPADMDIACRIESVKELQVIAHDGTRYFLEIGTGKRPEDHIIDDEFYKTLNKLQSKYDNMFKKTKNNELVWKEHTHEVNEMLAKQFGWNYRRELPR